MKGGLASISSMAGHGGDIAFGLAGGRAIEVETKMGILDFPVEQRSLGGVGLARSRLGAGYFATRPRRSKHSRRSQKRARLIQQGLTLSERSEDWRYALVQGCSRGHRTGVTWESGLGVRRGPRSHLANFELEN